MCCLRGRSRGWTGSEEQSSGGRVGGVAERGGHARVLIGLLWRSFRGLLSAFSGVTWASGSMLALSDGDAHHCIKWIGRG